MLGEDADDVADQFAIRDHPVIGEPAPFGGIARSALLGVELADQLIAACRQRRQQFEQRADIPAAIGDGDDLGLARQPVERGEHARVERDAVGDEDVDRRIALGDPVDQLDRDLGIEEMEDERRLHAGLPPPASRRAICRA